VLIKSVLPRSPSGLRPLAPNNADGRKSSSELDCYGWREWGVAVRSVVEVRERGNMCGKRYWTGVVMVTRQGAFKECKAR